MVAQQVLRKAVVAVLVAAASPAGAGPKHENAGSIAIGVVDLGGGDAGERQKRRATFEADLAGVQGIEIVADADLRAALAGEHVDAQAEAGRRAVTAAGSAFGALDCARAEKEADAAVVALAAAQAAGGSVDAELVQAYAYLLLCADQKGDAGRTQFAARQLRALRAPEPPPGVSDAIWAKVPAIDVTTGVKRSALAIEVTPEKSAVWIDHAAVGVAPYTALLPEGDHVIAATSGGAGAATRVTVGGGAGKVALAVAAARTRHGAIETRVRAWRSGAVRANGAGLGQLLGAARLRYAVVVNARGKLEVWQARGDKPARHLGTAADALEVGAVVADAEQRRTSPGIDPDVPLLRETPGERDALADKEKGHDWWVYAAIIGAVGLGVGIVIANELGDDKQRIEITVP